MSSLEKKRREMDLSQTDLAKKLDVSPSTISAWEGGSRTPSPGYYGPLAKALKVSAAEIVEMVSEIQAATAAK